MLRVLNDLIWRCPNLKSLITVQRWVAAYYIGQYRGHKTSNIIESTNNVSRGNRELPILDLLNTIVLPGIMSWTSYLSDIHTSNLVLNFTLHTVLTSLVQMSNWLNAPLLKCQISSLTTGTIMQRNQKSFVIDLWFRTCTCGYFQVNGIPYGHAITLIYALQVRDPPHPHPRNYVLYYFTIFAWPRTYQEICDQFPSLMSKQSPMEKVLSIYSGGPEASGHFQNHSQNRQK